MEKTTSVVLITGCGRENGIGIACCRAFLQKGYQVVGTTRTEESRQKVKSQLSGVDFVIMDVTNEESVNSIKQYITSKYKKLDVLVNNAGTMTKEISPLGSDTESCKHVMDVNAFGALRCMKAFVPLMKENNYGRIVNISTGVGQIRHMGAYTNLPYATSKIAMNAITVMIAAQLKQENSNISVYALSPGFVKTDMNKETPEDLPSKLGMKWVTAESIADEVFQLVCNKDAPTGTHWFQNQQTEW